MRIWLKVRWEPRLARNLTVRLPFEYHANEIFLLCPYVSFRFVSYVNINIMIITLLLLSVSGWGDKLLSGEVVY